MSNLAVANLLLGLGLGVGFGYIYHRLKERTLRLELSAKENLLRSELQVREVHFREQARLDVEKDVAARNSELEAQVQTRLKELDADDQRLMGREEAITRQLDRFGLQELHLRERGEDLETAKSNLSLQLQELEKDREQTHRRLSEITGISREEARTQFLRVVEQEVARDAAQLTRQIIEGSRMRAEQESRRILATALQRYATKHTFETTTAMVTLSGDEMKGRIIGRDGRNIRAFEAVTGVTVLVDDTPNAVILSGFDPVRREIARLAMERLILDGRIHPARIEEVVIGVNQEIEGLILRTGEDAVFKTGLAPVSADVAKVLGRLHFRHSYAQNVLEHSMEVAHLCGLMAAELGEDVSLAKRAGLLHDIGKAIGHEVEGPHAIVGADFIKKFGESPMVVNAVASHHGEVPYENIFGILVSTADAISAARPGARSESMTVYLKRLEHLEEIALDFEGVERAFAVQAGRELRVIVRPEVVDDAASIHLARKMVRRIEEELHYPGQIRVTVIRETRCVEYAK